MTNIYPSQNRAVDPFASYNSNVINELTRIITNGTNCLYGASDLQLTKNITIPDTVLDLSIGRCFKDDVMIEISSTFNIDTTDPAFYESGIRDMVGLYYVVLKYTYVKSRPAPRAAIKIFRPDQHGLLGPGYLFLKAFTVILIGSDLVNDQLLDQDILNLPLAQRMYQNTRVGSIYSLPLWYHSETGRIIYVQERDELFWGTGDGIDGTYTGWETFTGIRDNVDTSLGYIGQIGYLNSSGQIVPAISTSVSALSSCVIMTVDSSHGKVRLCGTADRVPFETATPFSTNPIVGDKLWLSQLSAGFCSNHRPAGGTSQSIGTCVRNNGDGTLYIWFFPGFSEDQDLYAQAARKYRTQVSGASWVSSGGMYRATINHNLGFLVTVVQCYDNTSNKMFNPVEIQLVDTNNLYIWMLDNTHTVNVIVLG